MGASGRTAQGVIRGAATTWLQIYRLAETFSMAPVDADVIIDCRTGSASHELACAGADKPQTVCGALTWLALGRPLPFPVDVDATLLRGSRIVICGGGGHHRTLACFLWGAGELVGEITIVDELADEELHAACRVIDSRLPHPTRGYGSSPIPRTCRTPRAAARAGRAPATSATGSQSATCRRLYPTSKSLSSP